MPAASGVYGSDAIAGVVNFKLKDKFEGLRFDGGWGRTIVATARKFSEVSRIDTQVDWSASVGPGELGVNLIASWMDEYVVRKVQGLPSTDDVGYVGGFLGASLPEWKWNLTLRYGWGPLDVSAQWRYIDGMRDREESNFIVPG